MCQHLLPRNTHAHWGDLEGGVDYSYEVVPASVVALGSVVSILSRDHDLALCPAQQPDLYRSLRADGVRSSDDPPRDDISRLIRTADAVEVDVQVRTCRSSCLRHRDCD